MLTKDLIKPTLRKGKIHPRFIKSDDEPTLQLAEDMILILQDSVGQTFGEMEELIEDLPSDRFRTRQAFWKILSDESKWTELNQDSISERRWQVFHQGTILRQSKNFDSLKAYREQLAEHLGFDHEHLSLNLFSDLPEYRRLGAAPKTSAQELINLYNMSQVQGLLIRARTLRLNLAGLDQASLRGFLRKLKFSQLMWDFSTFKETQSIEISGPLKIFDQQQSYGMKLAQLLPALLNLKKFQLEAEIQFGLKISSLILDNKYPMKATNAAWSAYIPDELKEGLRLLEEEFKEHKISSDPHPMTLQSGLSFVPDLIISISEKRQIPLELFHRWHGGQLIQRLTTLSEMSHKLDYLIGVDKNIAKKKEFQEFLAASPIFQRQGFIYSHFPRAKQITQALQKLLD